MYIYIYLIRQHMLILLTTIITTSMIKFVVIVLNNLLNWNNKHLNYKYKFNNCMSIIQYHFK